MSVDSSCQYDGWNGVQDALAEIGAGSHELHGVVVNLFDQLGRLTEEFLLGELARLQTERCAERDVLAGQIDRLAALTAELAGAVAEQKQRDG